MSTVKVLTSNPAVKPSHPLLAQITAGCDQLDALVPLKLIRIWPSGVAGKWNYKAETADGRIWEETMSFGVPPTHNPMLTFSVSAPGFMLVEIELARPIQAGLVQAVVDLGLTEFKYSAD